MLGDIKNTIKQSAVYGLSRIALRGVSLILIPVYTSKFTADSIANINLMESFWQYLFTICLFGVETAIINFCTSETNESIRKKLLFNFFSILLVNSIVFAIFSNLFSGDISTFILKSESFSRVITYCFYISIFESLLIMPLTIARINSKPVLYTVIAVSSITINIALQLYFILVLALNFEYVFLAKFIAPAVVFVITLPYLIKNLSMNFEFTPLSKILKFSFPLMIAMLLSLLLNSIDRFIQTDFVDKQQIAVYTIAYGFGSVTNAFILAPFSLAINVIFWKKINDSNFRRFMTKSSTYLFFVMVLSSLVLALFMPYAFTILVRNKELWESLKIIPVILFANCFVALFTFPSLDMYYKRKTNIVLYIIIACLVFSFTANFTLIRYFGIYASAIIAVVSYLLMIGLGYFATRKYSFTVFEKYKIGLLSVLYVVFGGVLYFMNIQNVYLDILIKLLMILLFLFLLYLFRFFEPIEIQSIKGFVNKHVIRKISTKNS